MLRRSLEEFGDLGGIVYNRQTKQLIGGHQRVSILREDPTAEVVITDEQQETGYVALRGGVARFSYRVVDWPPEKEKLAMVAANKQGGEWDVSALQSLLLDVTDHDLVGFSEDEWNKLFPAPEIDLDPPPAPDPDDENQGIAHKCPQCGHEWTGKPHA